MDKKNLINEFKTNFKKAYYEHKKQLIEKKEKDESENARRKEEELSGKRNQEERGNMREMRKIIKNVEAFETQIKLEEQKLAAAKEESTRLAQSAAEQAERLAQAQQAAAAEQEAAAAAAEQAQQAERLAQQAAEAEQEAAAAAEQAAEAERLAQVEQAAVEQAAEAERLEQAQSIIDVVKQVENPPPLPNKPTDTFEEEAEDYEDIKRIINVVKEYDKTDGTIPVTGTETSIDIPTVIKAVENIEPEPKDITSNSIEIQKIIDAIEKYTSVLPNKPNDVPQIDVSLEMTKIIDAVENFLKQPENPPTEPPIIKTTEEPIENAIKYILENKVQNLQKYIESTANINAQKNGMTLLGYACLFLNLNAVNGIIPKEGLQKGDGNPGPLTILDEYIKSEDTREEAKKIKDILFPNIGSAIDNLIKNIFNRIAKPDSFLDAIKPLTINSEVKNGLTLLGVACLALNFEVANWLLKHGAKGNVGQNKPINILREHLKDGQWSPDTITNINALIVKMEEQSKEVGPGFEPGTGTGTGPGTRQAAALTPTNKPAADVAQGPISKQAVVNSDGSKIKQLESTITELKQQITDLTKNGALASIVGATTGAIQNAKNNVGNALSGTPSRQNTIIDDGELDNTVKTIGTAKNLKSERTITYDTEKKLFSVGGIEVNPVKTTTTNQSSVQSVSQEQKEVCTKEDCKQCSGTTAKERQCKKNCMPNSEFCKSHTGQKDSGSTETATSTATSTIETESTSTPQYMTAFKTEEDDEFNKLEKRLGAILAK